MNVKTLLFNQKLHKSPLQLYQDNGLLVSPHIAKRRTKGVCDTMVQGSGIAGNRWETLQIKSETPENTCLAQGQNVTRGWKAFVFYHKMHHLSSKTICHHPIYVQVRMEKAAHCKS